LDNSGGFESHLAGKKYFWRAPNFWRILNNFARVYFCLTDLADSGGFGICISKNQLISHFFLHFLEFIICQEIKIIFLQIILWKKKISFWLLLR
jgi:hypothetical protein